MIGYCPLASGSKGNSIYVGSRTTKILIDAGLSTRALQKRLAEISLSLEEIDAIMITHEHIDHIRGIELLANRLAIPLLANSDTAKAICSIFGGQFRFKIFTTGETFEFGDLQIHPFSVPHDAVDPVAFTITFSGIKLGFCADLGFVTTLVTHQLQKCDYLYLEANHQVSMVEACSRPQTYKKRVLGRQGHLSNEQCASLLKAISHEGLKHVHLAHLSSECNNPELAIKLVREALVDTRTTVSIAYQDVISQPIHLLQWNDQAIESNTGAARIV